VGSNHKAPLRADLSLHAANDIPRRDAAPDIAIVYPTTRPASIDLMQARAAESPPWHYYIDRLGVISQLLDEAQLARAVQGARWNGQNNLEQRSLAVAIEGHMQGMAPRQQEALVALLGELMRRHHLKRQQVLAASALCPEEPAASPAAVAPDAAPATAWHGYQQDASLTYAEVGGG
jgi:N-acetyl-anhydromuramyl-L-alanine amidase AmpD